MAKIFSLLFLVLCSISALAAPAIAADQPNPRAVTIQPFLQHVSFDATQPQKQISINVTNNTPTEFVFRPVAIDFGSLDETGGILFAGTNAPALVKKYGLANWLVIDSGQIKLAPGNTTSITAIIDNRSDLSPGGHYAAIVLASVQQGTTSQTIPNVSFQQNISALVFAIKTGGQKYDMNLDSVAHNGGLLRLPTRVTLRLYNSGNVQLVPRGTVKLVQGNTIISQGAINKESAYVLPETYRKMVVELGPVNKASYGLFSKFKLVIDYRYEGIDRTATKQIPITVINKFVFVIPAIIFILTLSYIRLVHQNPKARGYISKKTKSRSKNK